MALFFVTSSADKCAEIKALIPEIEQLAVDVHEIQELDPHKIIAHKLAEARQLRQEGSLMVEDTSLVFDGMRGLPGPLVKWFLKTIGSEGLHQLAQTFGAGATARTIIGYADEKGNQAFFEGEMRGTIVAPVRAKGFGWDVIFRPEGHDKTYAEMSKEEKNEISHRGKAVLKLKAFLER